ncbi:MAG TPA: c-type cytochrome, partial [Bacteroidetes bacterium]|nr:c-type cytochrome [Bacteroidota bacterium]
NLPISPGDKNQFGTRNTPTVLNAFLQYAQFWDAHARTVEEQCLGPIFGNFEMDMTDTVTLLKRLEEDEYYRTTFKEVFPRADTAISITTLQRAIGAFERTLTTPAPIDDYLKGDLNAISTKAKLGIKAFVDRGCIPCHSTNLIGGAMAQKFALYGYYWDYTNSDYIDKGRYKITKDPGDKFVFKVPQLRNVEKTYPYFHDGSVEDLKEAIKIMAMAETNIQLEEEEVDNINEFLKTLTGKIPDHAFESPK